MDHTSRTPPNAADLAADLGPVRSCKKPPVNAPAAIEFHGSSCRKFSPTVSHCIYRLNCSAWPLTLSWSGCTHLLSYSHKCAVKCGKECSPDSKAASYSRSFASDSLQAILIPCLCRVGCSTGDCMLRVAVPQFLPVSVPQLVSSLHP